MADGFASALTDRLNKVQNVVDDAAVRRITNKAGAAGKKAALEAAVQSLGADRKFSHWARGPALNAGYDGVVGKSQVVINFRGPWRLAEGGRRSSGQINPKRRGGHRAVKTPDGPRAHSRYGRSRGLNTYSKATRRASVDVPKAAHEQFLEEVGKAMS